MDRYAVIKDGVVKNIIVALGNFHIDGHELIRLDSSQNVSIGDIWDGDEFIPAPEPEPQPPSQEERIVALEAAMLELILGGAE